MRLRDLDSARWAQISRELLALCDEIADTDTNVISWPLNAPATDCFEHLMQASTFAWKQASLDFAQ